MMIDNIIKKRTDLINFFLSQDNTYNKEDILNKEFAVLSFSPTEEYIDSLQSSFDHLCVDLSTYIVTDTDEVYIKGIIVDVDRQSFQTIIHIQNKDSMISISCRDAVMSKYDDYFVVGEPVIAKCKVLFERLYLSFLVQLNNLDFFRKERNYMTGYSQRLIEEIMEDKKDDKIHYGLLIECSIVKTKKGRDMFRGTLFDGEKRRTFGMVKTKYNPILPKYALAGDFVSFNKPTSDFFLNNIEVIVL